MIILQSILDETGYVKSFMLHTNFPRKSKRPF